MKLKNKIAMITGGAQGIGEEIAVAFAREGADLVIVDLNEEKLKTVSEKIFVMGRDVLSARVDITDKPGVSALVADAVKKFGQIDILVNNAAYIKYDPFLDFKVEEWDHVMAVCLKGTFLCSQAAAGEMVKRKTGAIIVWYIEGAARKILVDTGGCDPEDPALKPWISPYSRMPDQELPHLLKSRFDLTPDDIDLVIISHLHWDHCCGNGLFPNAEFIVQEKELESAKNPIPIFSPIYVKKFIDDFPYTTVDGDKEIEKGVRVLLTPSHSEGLQGVLIEAENHRYFIAGDNISLYESLSHDPPWPTGLYVNFREYYQSLDRITKLDATILPAHDMKVFETIFFH